MKKLFLVLIAVLIVLMMPVQAMADVIYEPWDSFYEEHRDSCEYHSRSYTAAGPKGDVTVYESPESAWKVTSLPNGTGLWISYVYEDADGIRWGCWEDWEKDLLGWVPMDYLLLIYDGISFDEEHGHEFWNEEGTLDAQYKGQTIYFWDYPGCETSSWYTLSPEEAYLPEYRVCYKDSEGRTWGKLSYFMGHRDSWVCLDDPTAEFAELYPEGIPETEPPVTAAEQEGPVEEIVPDGNPYLKWIVIGAVAATVVVTALLLFFLKK